MDKASWVSSVLKPFLHKSICKTPVEGPPGASSKASGSKFYLQNAQGTLFITLVLTGGTNFLVQPCLPEQALSSVHTVPVIPNTIQAYSWCSVHVDGGSHPEA